MGQINLDGLGTMVGVALGAMAGWAVSAVIALVVVFSVGPVEWLYWSSHLIPLAGAVIGGFLMRG